MCISLQGIVYTKLRVLYFMGNLRDFKGNLLIRPFCHKRPMLEPSLRCSSAVISIFFFLESIETKLHSLQARPNGLTWPENAYKQKVLRP